MARTDWSGFRSMRPKTKIPTHLVQNPASRKFLSSPMLLLLLQWGNVWPGAGSVEVLLNIYISLLLLLQWGNVWPGAGSVEVLLNIYI